MDSKKPALIYGSDIETEMVMLVGQLHWFCNQIEDDDNINPSLVLRGIVRQLENLVEPIAALEMSAAKQPKAVGA